MYASVKELYARFNRILGEIIPYRIKKREKLDNWLFVRSESDVPPEEGGIKINAGFKWPPEPFPVWFVKKMEFPQVKAEESLLLEVWTGGESLLLIDGKAYGEINEYHRSVDLSEFADGKKHTIAIQTVPKGLFGTSVFEPVFEGGLLLTIDVGIDASITAFRIAMEVLKNTKNPLLVEKLAMFLDEAFSNVQIPRDSQSYFMAAKGNPALYPEVSKIWAPEKFEASSGNLLSVDQRESIIKGAERLKKRLEELKGLIPPIGKLIISGQSHIDYAWLWPIEETKRKIRRTFANSVRLARKYRNFIYAQSSAQMYKDIKEKDPELYNEIKELVRKGQWIPIGGMWVESDCNVPGAESLIRQFLLGQRFFMREFGIKSRTAWLPDVFGFSWILPQILKNAGIEYFFTIKLNWNEKNKMPSDLFRWRGIDGSEVIYHSFDNPNGNYNGHLEPFDIIQTWENYKDKATHPVSLFTFGFGDGGGGPTDEMLENYNILHDFPGLPKLEMKPPQEYFEEVSGKADKLPVWDNELYFELHRGTLTSQSRTKKLHKKGEDLLYDVELLSRLAFDDNEYPSQEISRAWEVLLHNEFHDILPGSSIAEVYRDAEAELSKMLEDLVALKERALKRLIEYSENRITVINTGTYPKKLIFNANLGGKVLKRSDGEILKPQKTQDGQWLYCAEKNIAPFSIESLEILDETAEVEMPIKESNILENEFLRVTVHEDGSLSIYDKEFNREVFKGEGNQLWLYNDVPAYWDAWDVDYHHKIYGKRLKANSIEKVEIGEIRSTIRVTYNFESSRITQNISLLKDSRRVDVHTQVDWHHRRSLLKALFPVNVLSRSARYDLSAGYIERPTHRNTDFEKARFEVPAHRWMDISERDYGTSILNDGKYGHSCHDNVMELTLLRSPVFPHFFGDEGKHSFTYAIYPHPGSDLLDVVKEAEALNRALLVIPGKPSTTGRFLTIDADTLKLLALKRAEDGGTVVRVAEVLGSRGKAHIKLSGKFKEVWLASILEEPLQKLEIVDSTVEIEYDPFKIYTFLLK